MTNPASNKDDAPFEIEREHSFDEPREVGLAPPPLQLMPLDPSQAPEAVRAEARSFLPPRLIERRENMLESLLELSQELGALHDPFTIAEQVAHDVMAPFGARRAAVWGWLDDVPGAVATLCAFGVSAERAAAAGAALRNATDSPDAAANETRVIELPAAAIDAGFVLALPILSHGARLGVFALGERGDGQPYPAIEREHANAAARLLGVALENAQRQHHFAEALRQLRRANDDLVERDGLHAERMSNAQRELRAPIAALLDLVQSLERTGGLGGATARALGAMKEQAQTLGRLADDLLDASVPSPAEPLDREPVQLPELLRRYADERRPGVLEGLRSIEVEVAPFAPRALADARRLARVLDALVDNACRFTPVGSRVVLRADSLTRDGARWAVIEVEDDGPGIPPERRAELFGAPRAGEGSRTSPAGHGLVQARAHAERMDGSLELRAAREHGAVFRVLLRAA